MLCSIVLETGIFISQVVWLLRTRKLRKQAKLAGLIFDDLPEARPYQVKRPENDGEGEISTIDIEQGNLHPDGLLNAHGSSDTQRADNVDGQIPLKMVDLGR